MPWRDVPLDDKVVVTSTGILTGGEGIIVGSPPVWKDDSDASYASFAGRYLGTGQPAFYGSASAGVAPGALSGRPTKIRVHLRLAAVAGTSPKMPQFQLKEQVSGGIQRTYKPTDLAPTSPTWVAHEFDNMTVADLEKFKGNPSVWSLAVLPPGYASPVPNELQRFTVYELRLEVKVSGDAPPCRIFPRSDGLGIGAGRAFPPPKSQQRSPGNRGVGYY